MRRRRPGWKRGATKRDIRKRVDKAIDDVLAETGGVPPAPELPELPKPKDTRVQSIMLPPDTELEDADEDEVGIIGNGTAPVGGK